MRENKYRDENKIRDRGRKGNIGASWKKRKQSCDIKRRGGKWKTEKRRQKNGKCVNEFWKAEFFLAKNEHEERKR